MNVTGQRTVNAFAIAGWTHIALTLRQGGIPLARPASRQA